MGVNTSKKVNNPNELIKNKSKLSCFLNSKLQRENIVFLKQLGLFYCYTWLKRDQLNRELLIVLKLQLQKESIRIYKIANRELCKNPHIIFGTEKRDTSIQHFIKFLNLL